MRGDGVLTVNHELFHLVQYDHLSGCDKVEIWFLCSGDTTSWWLEATANWAQDHDPSGDRFRFLAFTPTPYFYDPPPDIDVFLSRPTGGSPRRTIIGSTGRLRSWSISMTGSVPTSSGSRICSSTKATTGIRSRSSVTCWVMSTAPTWDPTHFGEVLPDFWSAVYLLSRANSTEPNLRWDDIHVEDWRRALTSTARTAGDAFSLKERPHRVVAGGLAVSAEGDAHVNDLDIQAGGAVFVDVAPGAGFDGNLNVTVDVPTHGSQAEVRVMPYHNDEYPLLCASGSISQVQGGTPDSSGTYETTIESAKRAPTPPWWSPTSTRPARTPSPQLSMSPSKTPPRQLLMTRVISTPGSGATAGYWTRPRKPNRSSNSKMEPSSLRDRLLRAAPHG